MDLAHIVCMPLSLMFRNTDDRLDLPTVIDDIPINVLPPCRVSADSALVRLLC